MSTTNVISPVENLIDAVVAALEIQPSMRDLSNQLIVFPGKRPAHFVRKKIGSVVGSSYLPPQMYSIEEFIEFLFRQKLGKAEQVLGTLDAIALLFELHQSMNEKIGGGHFISLDRFMSLGWTLFGELEELVLANVSVAKLKSLTPGLQYGSIQMLGNYYEQFYAALKQRGLVTRALQYKEVAEQIEHIDLSEYSHLVLAGFFAPTHMEQTIFASLRAQNNTVFIFQRVEGIQPPNNALWQNMSAVESKLPLPQQPEIHFYQASDTHGQVYALSALLQEQINHGNPLDEHSAVVLPDAKALFPVVHETLPLLPEDEYNIALGYPVMRTPVYGFLQTLVALAVHMEKNTMPISAYLKFMLHPFTKNIRAGTETESTRVLVHTMEELFARDRTALFLSLEEIENHPKLFDRAMTRLADSEHPSTKEELRMHLAEIHTQTIRQLADVHSIGEFSQRCVAVLTYMFEHSTASMHPLFRQYAEKIIALLQEVPMTNLGGMAFAEPAGYLSFLKNYLGSADVPFSGTPLQGLQVLGLLETRNLQFDSVCVLDVNEGVLPPGRGTDMLLPQSLRTLLKMETYRDREALAEYYFNLLVQGAKKVHLFFTETPNGEHERSRFIQKLLWQEEQHAGRLLNNRIESVRYRVQLANKTPKPIKKTDAMIGLLGSLEYSATSLDTYLQCPLQFYYHYVLGLREQEAVSDEMDQLDVGTLVHEILKNLFSPLINQRLTESTLKALSINEVVRKEFQKQFGSELRGAQQLMFIQIQRQIKQFLAQYQIPAASTQAIVVTGLEQDLRAFTNGVVLRATCDRIEQRGETIHILDYKISGSDSRYKVNWNKLNIDDRASWNKPIGSLQLPFYVRIYSLITGTSAETIIPAYLLLGKNTIDETIETPLVPDGEDRGSCYRTAEKIIDGLIREIQSSDIAFEPPQVLSDACPQCPFTAICGTTWVQGWSGE